MAESQLEAGRSTEATSSGMKIKHLIRDHELFGNVLDSFRQLHFIYEKFQMFDILMNLSSA